MKMLADIIFNRFEDCTSSPPGQMFAPFVPRSLVQFDDR
jgi:hypothetical protein